MERNKETGKITLVNETEGDVAWDGVDELINEYSRSHDEDGDDDDIGPEGKRLVEAVNILENDPEYPLELDIKSSEVVIEGLKKVATEDRSWDPDSQSVARQMLDDIGEPIPQPTA